MSGWDSTAPTWDEVKAWMRDRIAQGKQLSAESYALDAYIHLSRPYALTVLRTMAQDIMADFVAPGPGPEAAYIDDSYQPRMCDRCSKPYRGPAVYCSLRCAIEDA